MIKQAIFLQMVILVWMFILSKIVVNILSYKLYNICMILTPLIIFVCGMSFIVKNNEDVNTTLKIITFCMIMFGVIILAWNTDDAYHGFVMARNWVEGNGLVYNVGERVNASTMPLQTIMHGILYFLCGDMMFAAMYLGIIESGLAVLLILLFFCDNKWKIGITFFVWFSKGLMTFSTSGLENSLLFLLAVLLMNSLFQAKENYDRRKLLEIAFYMGLIAFARMDAVLIFVPVSLYVFFLKRNKEISFGTCIVIGIIGLSPIIVWEVFSLLYYGFLFPNTAYAKLGTGYPIQDYWLRGISYFIATFLTDSVIIIVQVSYIYLALKSKNTLHICIASGIFLYSIFLINVGGDFMVGRHFTVTAVTSLCGITLINEKSYTETIRTVIISSVFLSTVLCGPLQKHILWGTEKGILFTAAVADERAFYFDSTCLLSKLGIFSNHDYEIWSSEEIAEIEKSNVKGKVINWAPGILRYYYAREKIVEDPHALGDAFLTKLKAVDEGASWRIGHMRRIIPAGYNETLELGQNCLVNPYLHEYYDKLSLIIKGDLFNRERLKTIININLGKYDYLLEEYQRELSEGFAPS